MRADNTSALSWMQYAARSHRPVVRELSRFFLALTLASPILFKLSGQHLSSKLNTGASLDAQAHPLTTWHVAVSYCCVDERLETPQQGGL